MEESLTDNGTSTTDTEPGSDTNLDTDSDSPGDGWEPDISEEAVANKVEEMGGLADEETARRLLEIDAAEKAGKLDEVVDKSNEEVTPQCDYGCGNAAVVSGVVVVNGRVYLNRPVCADCFIPADEIDFPDDVDEEVILAEHEDSLITTPADEVLVVGDVTIIRHGSGKESRVRLG
jgi:hypothetical protein